MRRVVCLSALAIYSSVLSAQSCDNPKVFIDSNRNGILDAREKGLAHIGVSDGEQIVYSDEDGVYRLPAQSGHTVFVIKPAGFGMPRRKDGLLDRFANQPSQHQGLKYGGVTQADTPCKNFALWPEQEMPNRELSVWVFGDPQPKSMRDIGYYRQDLVEPLKANAGAQLGISLGDIVHDDLSLYPEIKAVDKSLDTPWMYVAGNHDIDFDAADDAQSLESFRAGFGPDTYAWQEPKANFIVLDDVVYLPGNSPEYVGGLRESQFRFLEAYLSKADKRRLLVIAAHIPFFHTRTDRDTFRREDRIRLFKMLEPFRDVLLLTAHTHSQNHVRHGVDTDWHGAGRLHEYNAGAACGAYWSGHKDQQGIPDAMMADGTPNGYARLDIGADDYRISWFNARQKPNQAMSLSAPKALRKGAYPGFAVYANVYMATAGTQVHVRIDDGAWHAMNKVLQADPKVLQINAQDNQASPLLSYDRMPEATASSHLWRYPLPTDLPAGQHVITVRAQDAWLGTQQQSTQYTLQEMEP